MEFLSRFGAAMAALITVVALVGLVLGAFSPVALVGPIAGLALSSLLARGDRAALAKAPTVRDVRSAKERYVAAPESELVRSRVERLERDIEEALGFPKKPAPPTRKGTLASRPAAWQVGDGAVYLSTDAGAFLTQGGAWRRMTDVEREARRKHAQIKEAHEAVGKHRDFGPAEIREQTLVALRGGPLDGKVVPRGAFKGRYYREALVDAEAGPILGKNALPLALGSTVAEYRLEHDETWDKLVGVHAP